MKSESVKCPNGFIRVTALYDGKEALIRAACIDSVSDDAEEKVDYGVKPACRRITYSGNCIDVVESLDEIADMIYSAEL
ncbi:MAG: hypothetical protein IJ588_12425 [Prevotella sp.]|nr:hypothetical protein [Prevotella sp.]